MKILVEVRQVYGEEKIYPLCPTGKIFTEIAGTKTLTRKTINLIKDLGYLIEVKQVSI
jgi:hypothetical protein